MTDGLPGVGRISLEDIVTTKPTPFAASDFSASKSENFKGVGFTTPMVSYDSTLIDSRGIRQISASALLAPTAADFDDMQTVEINNSLFQHTLCNFDLSKVSETPKANELRSVQSHHLDQLKYVLKCLRTTTEASSTLASLGCGAGCVTERSSPDGYFTDDNNVVRGIFEVKHSVDSTIVPLRQAVGEGTNVALAQYRKGVAWHDIFVPLVGGNGHTMQFAVLVVLPPFLPYVVMLSKVLDLTDSSDRRLAAGHLFKICRFVASPLQLVGEPAGPPLTEAFLSYSTSELHLKEASAFFRSKRGSHDSLRHLFAVMHVLFENEECREHVLCPLCVRQDEASFQIVFRRLSEYRIGLPSDDALRRKYIDAVEQALSLIHSCGVAHLDFYPSNIMWKAEDSDIGIHVVIIDWDAAHFVDEVMCDCVQERLSATRKALVKGLDNKKGTHADYDISLLKVLTDNADNPMLQCDQKEGLDKAFRDLTELAAAKCVHNTML